MYTAEKWWNTPRVRLTLYVLSDDIVRLGSQISLTLYPPCWTLVSWSHFCQRQQFYCRSTLWWYDPFNCRRSSCGIRTQWSTMELVAAMGINQCIVNPSRSLSVRSKLECGIICKNDLRCTEWNYWKDTRQCDLYYSVVGNSPATYSVIPGCSSFRDPNPPRGFYFVRCYIEFHQHAAWFRIQLLLAVLIVLYIFTPSSHIAGLERTV